MGESGAADRGQTRLRRSGGDFFSPFRLGEAAALQKGVSDHRHQRMTMQTMPGSARFRHDRPALVLARKLDKRRRALASAVSQASSRDYLSNLPADAKAAVPDACRKARTKPEIALAEIDRVISAGVRFGVVLADAGYGLSAPFRHGLDTRSLKTICQSSAKPLSR